jgi:hypothetical protein
MPFIKYPLHKHTNYFYKNTALLHLPFPATNSQQKEGLSTTRQAILRGMISSAAPNRLIIADVEVYPVVFWLPCGAW